MDVVLAKALEIRRNRDAETQQEAITALRLAVEQSNPVDSLGAVTGVVRQLVDAQAVLLQQQREQFEDILARQDRMMEQLVQAISQIRTDVTLSQQPVTVEAPNVEVAAPAVTVAAPNVEVNPQVNAGVTVERRAPESATIQHADGSSSFVSFKFRE